MDDKHMLDMGKSFMMLVHLIKHTLIYKVFRDDGDLSLTKKILHPLN